MCNLSFDVVRVLRTQPLCLLFVCVTFLLTLFGSSPKKRFFWHSPKEIVCNNLLQVCNLIPFTFMFEFIELMVFRYLWKLSLTSSIANKFLNEVSPCLFSFILSSTCVFFSWTWGAHPLKCMNIFIELTSSPNPTPTTSFFPMGSTNKSKVCVWTFSWDL